MEGKKVKKDDDLMSLDEFINCCKDGSFTNNDGYGEYVDSTTGFKTGIKLRPSDVKKNNIRSGYKFIVWYNR